MKFKKVFRNIGNVQSTIFHGNKKLRRKFNKVRFGLKKALTRPFKYVSPVNSAQAYSSSGSPYGATGSIVGRY